MPAGVAGSGSDDVVTQERSSVAESRSLVEMLTVLLRRRAMLLGLPLATALVALLVSIVMLPRLYTVESRFTPESAQPQMSRLLGLASQFGVELGAQGQASVDFYAELLESRELLRSAVLTEYTFALRDGEQVSGNLVELFEVKGDSEEERILSAVERLDDLVVARVDGTAGIVSVRVSAPWSELSVRISERLLALVNEFNLERRQSRASAERDFLEARVREAATELRAAEASLERFMNENRRYNESPQLAFEYGRLQRQVELVQAVYRSLVQGFEQARVDEVRNTPVITVVDQPRGPARRTSPAYALNTALGLVLGFLLALGIILAQELMADARRARPREFERLERETRGFMHALRPWRRR